MVIGSGMIARKFSAYHSNDGVAIFSSGVSNSREINADPYKREIDLLKRTMELNPEKTLVYFSTCSIYDPAEENSRYVLHKKNIETLIKENASCFHIFRVSNLIGHSGNPNTVLNFFYYHMRNRINFDLWINSYRNLIDIDDMYLIADHIISQKKFLNEIINIANPGNHSVKEIIETLEKILGISANYIHISKGDNFRIDISPIQSIIQELGIIFGKTYINTLLNKYYKPA